MRLHEFRTEELLSAAEWAHWSNDDRFAQYLMTEIAERIIQEHPPDEQKMENPFEKSSEKAAASNSRKFRETDYDCDGSFVKRSN